MIDRPSCVHSTELWNADRVPNADDAVYSPASCRTAPVPISNRNCPAFAQIAASIAAGGNPRDFCRSRQKFASAPAADLRRSGRQSCGGSPQRRRSGLQVAPGFYWETGKISHSDNLQKTEIVKL